MTPRPAGKPKATGRPPVVLRDPQAIKALTHPARLAVLDEFFAGRELTATESAEIADVSPSAMSYHLRALEKAGIIERADSSADGRERPWRAAGSRVEIHSDVSSSTSAAGTVLMRSSLARMGRDLDAWMARRAGEPKAWREVAGLTDALLWLTPEEAEQIGTALGAIVAEYADRDEADRPDGTRRVRLGVLLSPSDEP